MNPPNDLAANPKYRDVILKHRGLLARFGKEHNDTLVAELLADEVKPIPFAAATLKREQRKRTKRNR